MTVFVITTPNQEYLTIVYHDSHLHISATELTTTAVLDEACASIKIFFGVRSKMFDNRMSPCDSSYNPKTVNSVPAESKRLSWPEHDSVHSGS